MLNSGVFAAHLLFTVILTIPVSLVLIWLYRRAVSGNMLAIVGNEATSDQDFHIEGYISSESSIQAHKLAHRMRLRLAVIYSLGAICAAVFWTCLFLWKSGIEFAMLRCFSLFLSNCWLIVPSLIILLALDRRRSFWASLAYVGFTFLAVVIWSVVSRILTGRDTITPLHNGFLALASLALTCIVPGAIILVAANRRLRGVSPLVLAGLLVFVFSSIGVNQLFIALTDRPELRDSAIKVGPNSLFMLATIPVGYICWKLLELLSGSYRRQAFSDVQLLVDSFWIIAAFTLAVSKASDLGWQSVWTLAGFFIYRAVVAIGLRLWKVSDTEGKTLLLLRVFGFQKRTERLFDAVAGQWRFEGEVRMIAGSDLAGRTIDPDDTLAFLGGDMRSRFVQSGDDLQAKLAALQHRRDPDGRFRIAEFFCHNDTWVPALRALLKRSDAILMDLRGFSQSNKGCLLELQELAVQRRIADTIFVVDGTTDVQLLKSTVGEPALKLQHVEKDSERDRIRLYEVLSSQNRTSATS